MWLFTYFIDCSTMPQTLMRYYTIHTYAKLAWHCCCLVAKLCLTLLWPYGLQPTSLLGIFQARILEWVAISSFRDLPDPGIEPVPPVSLHWQVDSLPLSHLSEIQRDPGCWNTFGLIFSNNGWWAYNKLIQKLSNIF